MDAATLEFPLTLAQSDIYFDQQRYPDDPIYNIGGYIRMGAMDAQVLRQAHARLVEGDDAFGLRIRATREGIVQYVASVRTTRLEEKDFSDALDPAAAALAWLDDRFREAFVLHEQELYRAWILRLSAEETWYCVIAHHLIIDGWGFANLARKLGCHCRGDATERSPGLHSVAADDVGYVDSPRYQDDARHWKSRVATAPEPLLQAYHRPRYRSGTAIPSGRETVSMPASEYAAVQALAERYRVGVPQVLLGVFVLCAGAQGDRDRFLIGLPVHNRRGQVQKQAIGVYTGMMPLAVELAPHMAFGDLVRALSERQRADYRHQRYPVGHLCRDLGISGSDATVFDVSFNYLKLDSRFEIGGHAASIHYLSHGFSQTPLALTVWEYGQTQPVEFHFDYNLAYLEPAESQRFAARFQHVLSRLLQVPELRLGDLSALPPQEAHAASGLGCGPRKEVAEVLVHRAFEAQARNQPDAIAVVDGQGSLSYAELNRQANRLAHRLIARGAAPDRPVAVCTERRRELLVGVLAVLKAGSAYLPIDPGQPDARIAAMLSDAEPLLVLVSASTEGRLAGLMGMEAVLVLDEAMQTPSASDAAADPDPRMLGLEAGHLAYIIYTSGSSGTPKGVMLTHAGLANLALTLQDTYALDANDRVLQFSSIGFDAATWDWARTLVAGATLYLCPETVRGSGEQLSDYLQQHAISHALIPPAALAHVDASRHYRLRSLIVGGEACDPTLASTWAAKCRLFNAYGPTEATIAVSQALLDPSDQVSIGSPLPNTELRIVDRHGGVAPIGAAGELWISGVGLARGYLGQPDATAQRFVVGQGALAGRRWYRTGDRARWRADGQLEFLGRLDDQLKVRGFRIEPGEIEAALNAMPEVLSAAVGAAGEGMQRRVIAYVCVVVPPTGADARHALFAELRQRLQRRLPDYMVPAQWVLMQRMPLNANGKIDRRALPSPDQEGSVDAQPQTDAERHVLRIWRALLGADQVGMDTDFFAAGGHSLLASRLAAELSACFARDVTLRFVFEHRSIRAQSQHVAPLAEPQRAMVRAQARDLLPLSLLQQRLWLDDRVEGANAQYNIPVGLRLRGALHLPALQAALQAVVDRHDVLRSGIREQHGYVVQHAVPALLPTLPVIDAGGPGQADLIFAYWRAEAAVPFDLAEPLKLRASLLAVAPDDHVLLLTLHHIAADGGSMRTLVADLNAAYRDTVGGCPTALPALPLQYADYAAWERQDVAVAERAQSLAFWREALQQAPSLHRLPLDRPRPLRYAALGAHFHTLIDATTVQRLEAFAARCETTLFMALHALLALTIGRWSDEQDVLVATPVDCREHPATEAMIGLFVNTLPLRTDLSGMPTFEQLLNRCRIATLAALAHRNVPFDDVVQAAAPERTPGAMPLCQILFSLDNAPLPAFVLPDLDVTAIEDERQPLPLNFDLDIAAERRDDALRVRWHYRPELFDAATVARFAESFHQLLAAALAQPQAPVHELEMLADSERGALRKLEGQGVHVAGAAPVFVRVEDVARTHPTAVAIVDDARTVCYQELERESNRLAHWLRSAGAGQGKRIGLYLPRSWRLPWAVLATLKTGAAYVPLDPGLPAARLQQIVQASALHAVVTLDHLRAQPALAGTRVLVVDNAAGLAALAAQDADTPAVHVRSDHPAYLIFTSGSTGVPKGVEVGHGALSAYLAGLQQVYAIAREDRLLQFSAFNFDVFVEECLMALCHGACLVIRDDASAESADAFWRFVDQHALSVLNLPTAFWHLLADTLSEDAVAIAGRHVRLCVVGGEAVRPASIVRWCEAMPATLRLLNGYGPTEATVTATVAELSASAAISPVAPIGRPLPHVRCLVLDGNGQRVPRGVSGELYLGGSALALGYAGDEALTAQRFVSLAAEPGRWYRTGDRVRWAQDGQLQFLGRADEQVKIRGYRIELGEVRARLDALAWVRESVVLAVEHPAGTRLAAYLVAADVHLAPAAVVERVRDALAQQLPHYMIPMIVPMARFPLTANGKIDLRALPPALVSEVGAAVAPQTAIERTLLALWERLLGLDRVGVEDDFFALGGHSLLAARLAAEASRALGHPVPARAVFEHPSVRRLATHLERSSSAAAAVPAIARAAVDDDAPLSPAQERLWFLAQLEPASRAYHMHAALQLQGTLDVAALRSAFVAVVARHSVLRSRFPEKDGRPRQVTDTEADSAFEWHVHDGATAHKRAEAERVLERSFDLQHGPLLRIALLREDHGTHLLCIAVHHIVFDGWSMRVLMDELGALYAAHRDGRDALLPALALRYVDYAVWERDWLSSPEATFQERAWAERLDGAPLLSTFPADRPRPAQAGGTAGTLPVAFDAAQTQALQAFSRRHGVTLFTTVLASWAAVLARMSGQQEIVLGTATANRDADAVAGMIGLFVNSLPLRLDMRRDLDVAGWLAQVRAQLLDAQQRQRLPLERVVEVAAPVRSLAHSPLFQVFVAWQDGDVADLELAGVRATALPVAAAGDAKFDVSLIVGESADGLSGLIEYAEALYERQTVEGWLTAWRCLLDAMLRDDHAAVQTLPLMQQAQRQRLLQDWAGRPRAYADALRLEQRFAQQVARAPDAIAVVDGELRWTYAQLDAHAATLAQRLQGQGLRAGGRVALALPRSAWLLAAQLATLRCGGAYVPLDMDAPPRRRAFMLEDSAACLLLRSTDQDTPVQSVAIDGLPGAAASVPTWASSAEGLDAVACVMYTSGSSGQPKGVAITHRGIRRLVVDGDYTEFGPGDCIAFAANPAFDASTMEVWAALLNGGRVAIADRDTVLEPARFGAFLQREAVTVLWLSVGLFNQYADAIGQALGALRCLLIGGDVLDAAIVARFLQRHRPAQLLNGYGPTETTTFAATYAIPSVVPGQSIPIGCPIRNTRLYVLDAAQQPVPVGAVGELYIGGDGVAAGYVNLPDLTAERFLPDPFAADGGRMYRSGDLARWRADGMLEFVGRRDAQVKLRGFRIELAGVQSCLAVHPSVRASVVIASGTAEDKRLLAYWVAADDAAASPAELRAHMAEHLPDYMIPAAFVQLDALPLTANGKIDRRRLPEPEAAAGLAEPTSATERLVADIWQQALRRSSIDVEQDFFALGGHSLLAMRLAGQIGQALGRRVPVKALFEHPSVRRLAQHLDTAVVEPMQPIAAEPGRVCAPLSFAQRRIWFADQLEGGSTQYNVPCALRLRGVLDLAALQATLDALVARHAVLRTVYAVEQGEPVQRVLPPSPVPLARLDLAAIARSELDIHVAQLLRDEASVAFDLSADIMLRGALVDLAAEEHLLLLTLHHIASDGESMGVVVREFGALYRAFLSGAADPLPPLPVQYADYAVWQQNWLGTDAAAGLRAHWRERLQGVPPVHALPLDRPRPLQQNFVAEAVECWLPSPLLQACKAFAAAHDATVFMVLQAALAALLSRWSGERDIVVGTPVSGRTQQEVEPLIGFFVNTVALRTELSAGIGFAELLAQVRERALAAFAHQDLPFDLVVDDLRPERTLAYNPVCQVKFVLQTQETGDLSLPGLDVEQIELGVDSIRFDFDVTAIEVEERLRMYWSFQTSLFDAVTVQRMAQAYVCLLQAALASPALPFERLPLQGNAATQALLELGRGPVSTQHRERSLVAQVQAQAAATPEAVAVRCGTQWLDYAGLERASNRLAQALQEQGIGPGARVGVALERSVALLVALLGTLKAGAAYVPLDLQQGPARLRQILDDAQVQLVLLDSASAFPLAGADTLFMDEAHRADWLSAYPSTAPVLAEDAQRSVYVLYTSGSTGIPKGVEIAHGSLLDYCAFAREGYYAGHLSGSLVATSVAFDLSVPSLYVPLLSGGCVTLLPPSDPLQGLAQALEDAAAPAWLLRLTPSHVQGLLGLVDATPRSSRHVFVIGGEAFAVELARALQAKYPQAQLYNHYGPTETVVGCAWYDVSAHLETLTHTIPIGVPMPNTGLYVVDAQGQLVPQGVAGELYIGGAGVGQGYVNQPDLTAQRFLPSPWVAGERVYRSGDRVRWRNDGTLEYLGRLDAQVKLRGYRIELGEIESQLRAQATVREAAVVVSGEGAQARLVAYVVPAVKLHANPADTAEALEALEAAEAAWTQCLQQALSQVLPGYMQPTAYVVLAALPLTANGKLDRAALPQAQVREAAYTAPCTPTEQALAQIWEAVLGQERISTEANFFALGGHSLLATRIVSEIGKRLGKPVPVRALFEQPTLQGLGRYVDGVWAQGHAPIPVLPREQPLALSFAQQRLWFIDRLEGGSAQYNMPVALQLDGDLDRTALRAALAALVARHEVLRTVYAEQDGQAVQVIVADATVPLLEQDLRELDAAAQAQALQQQREEEARQPFDLEREPMLRCRLLQLQAQRHALLFTMHHIASDGWSVGVLVQEFAALYAAQVRGEAAALAALPVQYADYAAWQRQRLQGATLQGHLGYWREQLAQLPVVHSLPLDAARPAQQRFDGGQWEVALPAPTLAALGALGQAHGASLFMVLEAALATVLWRWSGERDIVIGTPIAGRLHPDVEPLIGFFVNTLVLRTQIAPQARFVELLQARRDRILEAYTHQEVPFEMLVDELKPVRSLSHGPLFQVLLSMRNNARVALTLPGLEVSGLEGGEEPAKFDLQLSVTETGDGARLRWNYARSLFEAATIARLGQAYVAVLEAVAAAPQTPLQALPWVDAVTQATLAHWNATAQLVEDLTYPALVRRQALATPEAVAVRVGEQVLRYGQLEARANALAHRLRAQGVGRETVVALCLARGLEVPVAILGVMKAGAAYLPLDPAYPDGHLQYVLADSGAALVLTDAASAERVAGLAQPALPQLRMEAVDAVEEKDSAPPTVEGMSASDLAYVLYTSGTSGRPKGVLIEHGSLRNLAKNLGPHGIADGALQGCWAWTASYAFDGSLKGLMQLAWGGELLIVEEAAKTDPVLLRSVLEGQRVDLIDCTPSLLEAWLGAGLEDCLPHLVIGGEAIGASLWQRLVGWQQQRGRLAINVYGPTECCVDTTWSLVQGAVPVIGRALANVQCHVLAEDGQVQPIGVAGELYIGGAGVGRGYHGQPDLTAQRFVDSAWAPGERLYRSGDRVRWRNDGTLEYLGRLDAQVKLRGYRIELGEIESQLRAQATVREAAVVVSGEGAQARLVAYVVPAVPLEPEAAEAAWTQSLQQALSQVLPGYMQPTAYVVLAALPLTANGKLDRAALPHAQVRQAAYSAPRTPTEQALAQIWEAVLGQERISTEANFFALGGHSLLATRIVSEIGKRLGKPVPVRALFEQPTLQGLGRYVDGVRAQGHAPIPVLPREQPLALSFAQQRLWFIDRLEGGSAQYNMPVALQLDGDLDRTALRAALAALVARHEVLRTVYAEQDGQAVQVIVADATVPLLEQDLRELDAAAQAQALQQQREEEARQPFDLERGPMLRCRLLRLQAQRHALLFTMHHIASDGWSVGVLVQEFAALYAAQVRGEAAALAALPVQYADYAAWQRQRLQGATLQGHLGYWREQLAQLPVVHSLPLDAARPAQQRFDGGQWEVALPAPTLAALGALGQAHGASLFMVLEAALATVLWRWSGERDIVIGTPIAGRLHPDVEPLIGFFVNTLVLRTQIAPQAPFVELLQARRERILEAYTHQEVPFEMLVDELKPVRSLSHGPLFQVLLSMRNNARVALTLPGLEVSGLEGGEEPAKFDLQLSVTETGDGARLRWNYARSLFEAATIARLGQAYVAVLEAVAAAPQTPLQALPVHAASSLDTLLALGRGPMSTQYRERSLVAQVQAQAAATPEAVAVRCGTQWLDYAGLERASNRLAQALQEQGIGPGARVGVALERSVALLVALLGTLKAGAAYVPLDLQQGPARLRQILDDAQVQLVLGDAPTAAATLSMQGCEAPDWLSAYPATAPALADDAQRSVYVLYTSGSTGIPKGVEIAHGSLLDYCAFAREGYYAGHLSGSLVATSVAFDLSVPSLYVPLLSGGCVTLLPPSDPLQGLAQALEDAAAPAWLLRLTPSHVQGLLGLVDATPRSSRHVFVIGGEAFAVELARALQAKYPQAQLYNHYGPTETVVGCAWYDVSAHLETLTHTIPIGVPMPNTGLYVVDAQGQLVPQGVAGELYIGGAGVGQGYVNQPDLTAQRFLPSPWVAGERVYRSGDRVRWRNDGTLEYLGRLDAQVKLRGYRIELGEIESQLRAQATVREAAVVVSGEGAQARLVAYVVPATPLELEAAEAVWTQSLQQALSQVLPGYMQPTAYVVLAALPLTANGKLDRAALPQAQVREAAYSAPRTPTEQALAQIWEAALGQERISVSANFFDLGGHSLLATRLINAVQRQFHVALPVRVLFERSDIRSIGALIDAEIVRKRNAEAALEQHNQVEREW